MFPYILQNFYDRVVVAASQFLMGYIHAVTAKLEDLIRCATEALQLSQASRDRHLEGLNTY
jgi:hypothetical protein